jgi:anti-anti-sigma regulatory factor
MTSLVGTAQRGARRPHSQPPQPATRPERFAVRAVSAGQRSVSVALHGELDAATAPVLDDQLALFCFDDPWAMGGVPFIDPDLITTLVAARQALRARSCALTIVNPSATVRLSLEAHALTGLVEP